MSRDGRNKTPLATMFLRTVLVVGISLASSQRTPIYVSIMDTLTLSTRAPYRANYTIGAAFVAISDINNRSDILPNHELVPSLVLVPPIAPAGSAVRNFVEVFRANQDNISAFVGPPLSTEGIYSALLAAHADIPYLSWVATSSRFSDATDYSTFVRTSGNLALIGPAVVQFMDIFSWDRIAYIEYHDTTHLSVINAIRSYLLPALEAANKRVILDLELGDNSNLPAILNRAKQVARILFIAYTNQPDETILQAIQSENLDNGDYAVLLYAPLSDYDFAFADANTTNQYLDALKTVIIFSDETPQQIDTESYSHFLHRVADTSAQPPINIAGTTASTFAAQLYDVVYLYGLGLHEALQDGFSPANGSLVVKYMKNTTFDGISGPILFGEDGERNLVIAVFTLSTANGTYLYEKLYRSVTSGATPDASRIMWPAGRVSPPSDSPPCGFDGELCVTPTEAPTNLKLTAVSIVIVPLAVAAVALLVGQCYWKRRHAGLASTRYQIDPNELTFDVQDDGDRKVSIEQELQVLTSQPSRFGKLNSLFNSSQAKAYLKGWKAGYKKNNPSHSSVVWFGQYKTEDVAVKSLQCNIRFSDVCIKDLTNRMNLKHENILELLGVTQGSITCLVMPSMLRRSIQDVLSSRSVLPPEAEFYMLRGICQAMAYIHSSSIGVHGNLKSTNCLLDGRWIVKVSDMLPASIAKQCPAMKRCASVDKLSDLPQSDINGLAWTAPELLRKIGSNDNPIWRNWSKAADVYSFGIIMQEILLKGTPFCNNKPLTLSDCVFRVLDSPPEYPFRPCIQNNVGASEGYCQLMEAAWSEREDDRPPFSDILLQLQQTFPQLKNMNVMETLMERMSRYTAKLQEAVEERSAEVVKEKNKCDQLLSKMLPSHIVATLKQGQAVRAEQFDEVTVCFSAITDFPEIASQSNPIEIVNFLNKLYVAFDSIIERRNVYKVETIGDTYMLVAGLPKRLHLTHAAVVAESALALMKASHEFRIPHMPNSTLKLRVGMHSGPVVAGVIGSAMPRYCLFGDTVNMSSRMQSTGQSCKIQMSPTSYLLLWKGGRFSLEKRGRVAVKGKGGVNTFWLQGEDLLNSGGDPANLLLTKEDIGHYPILQTWLDEFGVQLN